MSLRDSKVFRVVGYGLVGLALCTGFAHIAFRALNGGWNAIYFSGTQIPWTYGSAFIAGCCFAVLGVAILVVRLQHRWRDARRDEPPSS